MRFILSDRFLDRLIEAGIIDQADTVYRVVIDLKVGEAMRVLVERYGDDRFLDVSLDGARDLVEEVTR
jgi:hypothetical protein